MREFPFRSWVRSTCRTAMIWGLGVLALLAAVAWLLRGPDSAPLGRAFGALAFYGTLFLATLLKIWYTAGRAAVAVDSGGIAYQPLHTFRPRRIGFETILAAAPRPGTQAYGIVFEHRPGRARELFLNLAVVEGRHELLDLVAERLAAAGLEPVAGEERAWRRPGWTEDRAAFT